MLSRTESSTLRCVSEGDSSWGIASTRDRWLTRVWCQRWADQTSQSWRQSRLTSVARGTPGPSDPRLSRMPSSRYVPSVDSLSSIQLLSFLLPHGEKVASILLTRVEKVECHWDESTYRFKHFGCIGASVLNPNRLMRDGAVIVEWWIRTASVGEDRS